MSYHFWPSARWFSGALRRLHLVIRFGKLRDPLLKDGDVVAAAAAGSVLDAFGDLRLKAGRSNTAELAKSGAFGPRMRREIRWTDAIGQHLRGRMSRVTQRQAPSADPAAADFIARAFQRAARDLLRDRGRRKQPTPFGEQVLVASLGTRRRLVRCAD